MMGYRYTTKVSKAFLLLGILLALLVISSIKIGADVSSPTSITYVKSSGFNTSLYPSKNVSAIAGNLTELSIVGTSQTKAWQGYYGNVTGTILLQDAVGNVFYNWTVAEPKGEVFASNSSSVNWASIKCFNYSANGSGEINLTQVESQYNINTNDPDSINVTFNTTNPLTFYVGSVTISAGSCPSTYIFNNTGYQTNNFINVLLTDRSSLVFTTILENHLTNVNTDIIGYDNQLHDFQMLVAEDGHGSDVSTTTYYFWVELQ